MTGHVRRRGERSWEIKFDLGTEPSTGKRLTRYHSFKGTKREAEAELTRLKAGADLGNYVDPSKLTITEFLARWERDWVTANVSAKTAERWSEVIRNQITPRIGRLPVQKVKAIHLATLYADLLREGKGKEGLAPRTVGHVHRLLHRALGHAAEWGVAQSNVATLVSPPKVDDVELEILEQSQIQAILDGLVGKPLRIIVETALATGMRRGELLALRWKDIDLDAGKLRVEQSLEQTKAGLKFKEPKTKTGRRSIALPAFLVTNLRAHRRMQQEQRMVLGQGKAPIDALVFPNVDGGPRRPDGLTMEWGRARKALGVSVSLHAFRHTHASTLIKSGMDILTISRRLGHSKPSMTLDVYGHVFPSTDAVAAQIMEAAFSSRTD